MGVWGVDVFRCFVLKVFRAFCFGVLPTILSGSAIDTVLSALVPVLLCVLWTEKSPPDIFLFRQRFRRSGPGNLPLDRSKWQVKLGGKL